MDSWDFLFLNDLREDTTYAAIEG